jgi:predicted permease
VDSASVSWWSLFSRGDIGLRTNIQDYMPAPNESIQPRFNFVSPGYFETVGMSLSAGRGIEERDVLNAPGVAVINETMVRRYFPTGDAIGKVMEIIEGFPGVRTNMPIEIVGVVRDSKFNDLRAETKPMVYLPIQQAPNALGSIEVRTTRPLAAMSSQVRNALLEVSRDLMIRRAVPLKAQVDQTLASERLLTTLATCFGVLALILASVGLYGVLSYTVAHRSQEIGIRRALGATDRNVVWMVLRQSMTVVFTGVAIGLALAFLCTRLISGFLYGLSPTDPTAIALSTLLLIIIALFACFLPALRATRVDPLVALRHE